MQQNIDVLSHQNILAALLVVLVLMWIAKQIMDFVLTARSLRKPMEKEANELTAHQSACDKKFATDKRRLDDLEPRMDSVEEGQRVLCKGVYEILGHLLHNGNKEQMEKASNDLFSFLNK